MPSWISSASNYTPVAAATTWSGGSGNKNFRGAAALAPIYALAGEARKLLAPNQERRFSMKKVFLFTLLMICFSILGTRGRTQNTPGAENTRIQMGKRAFLNKPVPAREVMTDGCSAEVAIVPS